MRIRIELLGHVLRLDPVPHSPEPYGEPGFSEAAAVDYRGPKSGGGGLGESGFRFEHDNEPRWRSPAWILPITGGGVLAVTLAQVIGADPSKPVEVLSALLGMTIAGLILHVMRKKAGR